MSAEKQLSLESTGALEDNTEDNAIIMTSLIKVEDYQDRNVEIRLIEDNASDKQLCLEHNEPEVVTEILEEKIEDVNSLKEECFPEDQINVEVRLLDENDEGSVLILSNLDPEQILRKDEDSTQSVEGIETEEVAGTQDEEHTAEEVYSCNSCGISFTSVVDHIQNFHSDQEVVVEMARDDDSIMEDMTLLQVLGSEDGEETDEAAEEIVPDSKRVILENGEIVTARQAVDSQGERFRSPQLLNTLHEEQCVDRDGRLYTRKVVQIERFWHQPEEEKQETVWVDETKDEEEEENKETKGTVSRIYYCSRCYTHYANLNKYENHTCKPAQGEEDIKDSQGKVSRVYHCSRCFAQYENLNKFENHACIPAPKGKYKCEHCNVSYNNSKSLCAHMKVHKTLKKNDKWATVKATAALGPYRCGVCDTIFPSNKSLLLHGRMHEPVKQRPVEGPVEYPPSTGPTPPGERFHCALCDKWIHIGYRTIHQTVHTGQVEFNCDICNRKFFTKENLEMHMNVHSVDKVQNVKSTKQLPYECNYCNRQFARPHEKVKHERIHTGEKPHSCDICGKSFRVSYCLTLHMRTHTGARPYNCGICGKRFKAHSVYNHHVLTHSNVRAYKCTFCPKAFKTSVQLAGHKNSHTKPFPCTECNRPFASLYAVRVHMETHKRQNNLKYNCEFCGASYARSFALRDHLKAQHGSVMDDTFILPEDKAATLSILEKNDDDILMEKVESNESELEIL